MPELMSSLQDPVPFTDLASACALPADADCAAGNAIQVAGLCKAYRNGRHAVTVFDDLTLNIPAGDFVAVMGPPGSGKSTLLKLLGGMDRPDAGQIRIGYTRIDQMPDAALAQWRGSNVGYVSHDVLPTLRTSQNVELPMLLRPLNAFQRRERVRTILRLVGLADRADHRASELSGEERQRIGIARALASDPKLLLCDEPTGRLDRGSAGGVLSILQTLSREMGKTVVMVSHDDGALRAASRVLRLHKGRS